MKVRRRYLERSVIYSLSDPRDGAVRYVGQTTRPDTRKAQHEKNTYQGNPAKSRWCDELLRLGLRPLFAVIEECEPALLNDRERYWSQVMTDRGHDLLNRPVGGITRADLFGAADLEALYERLTAIRDELSAHFMLTQTFARKSGAEMKGLERAVVGLDRVRWAIEGRLESRYASK